MEANAGHPETGSGHRHVHEKSDTPVHSVGILAGAFVGLLIFGLVVGFLAFRFLTSAESEGPPASPLTTVRPTPPEPRLQVNARGDWESYLNEQKKTLSTYGWVDRQAGVARIPIDEAMDDVLQKGLPVRAARAGGTEAPPVKSRNAAGAPATAHPPSDQAPAANPSSAQ